MGEGEDGRWGVLVLYYVEAETEAERLDERNGVDDEIYNTKAHTYLVMLAWALLMTMVPYANKQMTQIVMGKKVPFKGGS